MQFLKFLKPQPFPDGAALKIMAMEPRPWPEMSHTLRRRSGAINQTGK
jgi:hypothetical protein